jgi:uncharacterized protein (TIGR03435 family)
MLRNLVLDRFKPKVYRETAEGPGYVLGVARGGAKFRETSDPEDGPFLGAPVDGGRAEGIVLRGKFRLRRFVSLLATYAGGPVIDRTDLPGTYEFNLTLYKPPPDPNAVGGLRGGRNIPHSGYDPPLSEALDSQLGLRLDSVRVPIDYLVVERVEKPSEN